MNFAQLEQDAAAYGVFLMGALHDNDHTVVLLGADKATWPKFTSSPEYRDGESDPLDRWSKRQIGAMATTLGGEALFPSDGPPYLPFIAWARDSGRFWQSPTGMLVHDVAGLMVSIRGAIRVQGTHPLPAQASASPCEGCAAPCVDICPVGALSASKPYDVPVCKAHIAREAGRDCIQEGCRVRRVCPVSQSFERTAEQSAFHMRSFAGV